MHAARASGLQPQHWLVMNGDSYLGGDWPRLMASKKNGEACLVARQVADTGRYGRLDVNHGKLIGFREKQGGGEGLINAGIYLLPGIWLNGVMKQGALSMENDLIPGWLSEGHTIRVQEADAPFLDIGTPEDYAKADTFFANLE